VLPGSKGVVADDGAGGVLRRFSVSGHDEAERVLAHAYVSNMHTLKYLAHNKLRTTRRAAGTSGKRHHLTSTSTCLSTSSRLHPFYSHRHTLSSIRP
jgi:hypothetical protein